MSGGHWNYMADELQERGEGIANLYRLIAVFEHELDWGICHDTCLDCAKKRVAEALIIYFDGNIPAAIALARDSDQNRCQRCVEEFHG